MPGRPKARDRFRFVSGRQLWRLNTLGRLALADDAGPISSTDASVLAAELANKALYIIFAVLIGVSTIVWLLSQTLTPD